MKGRKFWLVWKQEGGTPTYQHETKESAQREAERLTRRWGGAFHVLEVVGTVERDDVKWSEPKSDSSAQQLHSASPTPDNSVSGYSATVFGTGDCTCSVCRNRRGY